MRKLPFSKMLDDEHEFETVTVMIIFIGIVLVVVPCIVMLWKLFKYTAW